jgi:hypothetical protein
MVWDLCGTVSEAGRVNIAVKFWVSRKACSILTLSATVSFLKGIYCNKLVNFLNVTNNTQNSSLDTDVLATWQ